MSGPLDAVYIAMPDAVPAPAAPPPMEKPTCPTCASVETTVALAPCGHRVCVACIKTYLETQIAEGIDSPTCPWREKQPGPDGDVVPYGTPCDALIRVQQVKRLVTANTRFKFEALRARNLGDYLRECPHCSHLQECAGPDTPECVCEACGVKFCFKHGRLHPYSACADYVKWRRVSGRTNGVVLVRGRVVCPECHTFMEVQGCTFVVCPNCATGFCSRCTVGVADAEAHYGPSGTRRCRGKYMDDYGKSIRNSVWATYLSLMAGKFTLDLDNTRRDRWLAVAASTVVVLPSMVLAIPIAPCWWTRRGHESLWIAYVTTTRCFMKIFIGIIKGILGALLDISPLGLVFGLVIC